ncbi:helix-turn-helix transcriptional regulator [Actinomadura sp. KC06]|uniref:helix-turn-helix domain-containing protein n=1 Tax=Actinomadura sp. KC06 TaxID=2530369 RepID=UPI001404E37D|nr:helix-turn-helix transcriptional regulator [Actinomadura sp. KC06]
MPRPESPTVRRIMLGIRLRALRTRAGVTADDAAHHIARTDSTISRMETGQSSVPARVLERLVDLYGATSEETAQLTELAKAARQRGWWQRYGEVLHPGFELYLGLEAEATEMHAYVSEWVPGLLQTAEYARAVLSVEPRPPADEEIEARVEARLARQAILSGDDPLHYWVVLDEAVLRRAVGSPQIMADQLGVLVSKARQRNIKLQVLPFSIGAHPGTCGSFTLLTLDLGDAAVSEYAYIENRAGALLMDKLPEIETHRLAFDSLRAQALSPRDSAAMIEKIAAEWND